MHLGTLIYRSILIAFSLLLVQTSTIAQDNYAAKEGRLYLTGVVNGQEVVTKSANVGVTLDSPSRTLSMRLDGASVTGLDGSPSDYSQKYPTSFEWFTSSDDLFMALQSDQSDFQVVVPMIVKVNEYQNSEEIVITGHQITATTGSTWVLEFRGRLDANTYGLNKSDFRFDEELNYSVTVYIAMRNQ